MRSYCGESACPLGCVARSYLRSPRTRPVVLAAEARPVRRPRQPSTRRCRRDRVEIVQRLPGVADEQLMQSANRLALKCSRVISAAASSRSSVVIRPPDGSVATFARVPTPVSVDLEHAMSAADDDQRLEQPRLVRPLIICGDEVSRRRGGNRLRELRRTRLYSLLRARRRLDR